MTDQTTTNPKVAIIGGSGFIGQVLIPDLQELGYTVRILDIAAPPVDRPDVEYRVADVRNLSDLVEHLRGCDLIVNLAAAHRDDVRPLSLYDEVNVAGAARVCEAAEQLGIDRLIFTSSVAIYGMQSGIPDEESPAQPFNAYGRTKWEAEAVYQSWQKAKPDSRTLVIVRPTVVFGPGNRGNVYTLFAQLAGGRFVMVGAGTNRKSMAYVRNIAAFLAHMVTSKSGEPGSYVYNYCDKDDFTMNGLLALVDEALGRSARSSLRVPYAIGILAGYIFDAVAAVTGKSFPISRVRVQKFCANTIFSADRLRETGFKPPYSLEQGLLDTIRLEFPRSSRAA